MAKTQQELAIEKVKGPCLVMAGAGTGNTYTIVHKVAHLINTKVCNASEILCLTFSNEATNNLRRQIGENITHANEVTIRTFHSFCTEILKELGHQIGIDPGFGILEPDDSVVWFHKHLGISPYYADLYAKSISTATDLGVSLSKLRNMLRN